MEQVASSALLEPSDRSAQERPLVFLGTDVILAYLRGDPSAAQLFSAEADGRIRFAVNGIVFQELLLSGDAAARPEIERIIDHLQVLPVDLAKAEALFPRVRALGDRKPHVNGILMVSSADECDYFVTGDELLKGLVTAAKPQVVTPEEFAVHLRAA